MRQGVADLSAAILAAAESRRCTAGRFVDPRIMDRRNGLRAVPLRPTMRHGAKKRNARLREPGVLSWRRCAIRSTMIRGSKNWPNAALLRGRGPVVS